jgi:hypothetical protein
VGATGETPVASQESGKRKGRNNILLVQLQKFSTYSVQTRLGASMSFRLDVQALNMLVITKITKESKPGDLCMEAWFDCRTGEKKQKAFDVSNSWLMMKMCAPNGCQQTPDRSVRNKLLDLFKA